MGSRLSNDEFISRSKAIHNNFYEYLDEYKNAHTKIKIFCPKHGLFYQKPYSHLQGVGCPRCGFEKSSSINRKKLDIFIEQSNKVHNNFYSYIKSLYKNNKENIIITCPIHGDFTQIPQHHLNGHGCPNCSPKKPNKSNGDFLLQVSMVHNKKYNYIEPYKGAHIPISIICPKHGEFKQTPNSHLKGRGCPECQFRNSSILEREWLNTLGINKKYRNIFIKIDGKIYKFDAYIPDTKTIYEFYGDFWHGNPRKYKDGEYNLKNNIKFSELYKKTIEREEFLKSKGYNIISIWEDEFIKNNKQIVNQKYKNK